MADHRTPGLLGQVNDLTQPPSLRIQRSGRGRGRAGQGDVAAILTEPVMTNSCMVLPEAGFHDGLRQLSLKYGALLIMDETHTISSGLGGYTAGAFAAARHLCRRQMRGGRDAHRRLGPDRGHGRAVYRGRCEA
jgi:hypothetical protein